MGVFAPRILNYDPEMQGDQGYQVDQQWWFGPRGYYNTTSGQRVTEDIALSLSAWSCGVRIISETIASLSCEIVEHSPDGKRTSLATKHPMWHMVHNEPNPEQDSMLFFDALIPNQIGYGTAYAEKQYDISGRVVWLWPIHSSRIPDTNIVRNSMTPVDPDSLVGAPGEIVFLVNNDYGPPTPIPASDMLVVPGVLTKNGITGRGLVKQGANSIGVCLATDQHTGSFFKNGAVFQVALTHPNKVSKEAADRLRESWQNVYGGASNHYKALILEEDMKAQMLSMDPEKAQLIASRNFGVLEIARWLRLPPHMLADLSRATYSNIEAENISFVVHSLMPWIVRWEKAMKRQLFSPADKLKYSFRFNVLGLLRGDSASRAAFYQAMFGIGAYSPNDIRAAEGLNPVEGGDEYFVPVNNVAPLRKAAQAMDQPEPAPQPLPDKTPKRMKQLKQQMEALTNSVKGLPNVEQEAAQIIESVQGLRGELVGMLAERETSREESLAIREQQIIERERENRHVARANLTATLVGMQAHEIRRIRDNAKDALSFGKWLGGFYDEFRVKLETALSAHPGIDPAEVAAVYISDSKLALTAPLEATPRDEAFPPALDACLTSWAQRPQQLALSLIPEPGNA